LVGFWLIAGTVKALLLRIDFKPSRLRAVPLAFYGMVLAHAGLGVFVLGAVVEGHERLSLQQPMAAGDSVHLGRYDMAFKGVSSQPGKNYDAQVGHFDITDAKGDLVCAAQPQRRFYPASNDMQSKVALCFQPLSDLYVVMAQPSVTATGKMGYQVRFFINPWVRLIFLGPVLMALGGVLSLSDRRLRLGVAARKARA
jgi:cytochrome c-type biogenesis protein CcmF